MTISGYGTMIAVGLLTSGFVGWRLTRRYALDFNDFLLLAVYTVVLGVVGAKAAYLLLNLPRIQWARVGDPAYLNALLAGGFIFYGGVPTGFFGFWLCQKVHHVDGKPYLRVGMPLLPLTHAFGRIGCALAGCCFGVPYDGPLAVTYHGAPGGAPSGIPLFPVQLAEALVEFAVFALLLWLCLRGWSAGRQLCVFLTVYGVARFFLEYLRYDAERGRFLWFSTSQWVSIFAVVGSLCALAVLRPGRPGAAA